MRGGGGGGKQGREFSDIVCFVFFDGLLCICFRRLPCNF